MIEPFPFIHDYELLNSEHYVLEEYNETINSYKKCNPNFYIESSSTFQDTNKEIEKINFDAENDYSINSYDINENIYENNIKPTNNNKIEFNEKKEKEEEEGKNDSKKKKKNKTNIFLIQKKKIKHTRDAKDNIRKKLKVHICKFIINLINDCIIFEGNKNEIKIKKLSQNINANTTIKDNKPLLELEIKEILKNNIYSPKYNKKDPTKNPFNNSDNDGTNSKTVLKLENNIEKYPKTNKLLNKKFIEIGKMFFDSDINFLKENYGLNKAKTFSDLIEKEKNDYVYQNKLKKVANNFFDFYIKEKKRNRIDKIKK